ncbi:MAG: methyltransferase domain-containing protein [Bacillota bacterium]
MSKMEEPKDVLTLEEASRLFQVSTKTFLKLLREEEIPARKVGREWRFSRIALLNWMESGNSRDYASAEAENKAYFAQVAPVYNEIRKDCYGDSLRDIILSQYTPPPGSEVADIGTGTGYLALGLAKYAAKVRAIDSSAAMLAVAGDDLAKAGLHNVELIEGDAHDLPVADAALDIVYANLLLHHLLEPGLAIKEMFRVLKPGGRVIITDINQHSHGWVKAEKFDLWLGFEREEIRQWFQEAGFLKITIADLGCNCRTSSRAGKTVDIPMFLAAGTKPV